MDTKTTTTKIESFDRANAATVIAEVKAALQTIADKYGLVIDTERMTFAPNQLNLKFSANTVADSGVVETSERRDFIRYATTYGLSPTDIDQTFTSNGATYTITGLNMKAHKMPILAKRSDGTGFKFSAETVVRGLVRKSSTSENQITTARNNRSLADRV